MMKFFRKYMKQLLAVFMGLLLVIWLGGDALMGMFRPDLQNLDMKRAEINGRTVTLADMMPVFGDLKVLNQIGIQWQMLWMYLTSASVPNDFYRYQMAMRIRDPQKQPLTEDEWYMLVEDARKRKVFVPKEQIEQITRSMDPATVTAVLRRHGLARKDIDRAVYTFVRVVESVREAGDGVKISEADIQEFIRQTRQRARINAVVVEGEKLIDPAYEPTEAEMIALFEEGKDRDPVPGSLTEFGYREPERVQIEYIQISAAELGRAQQVRDEEAFDYWTEHKNEFLRPSTQPASAPTTQRKAEQRQPYDTFTEARAEVIEKMRDERARNEALRLARDLISRLSRPWSAVPTTQPGCKELPDGEKSDTVYPQAIEAMAKRYPGVLKYARTSLMDMQELRTNPEIGPANALADTPQPIPLAQAAFMVCGLAYDRQSDPDAARLYRNLYETCSESLVDADGNVYVFRNVAAVAQHPPASWQQVRVQLAQDVRRKRAFEESKRQAQALAEQAAKVGLKPAFEADATLTAKLAKEAYKSPAPFARQQTMQMTLFPGWVPGVGSGEELMSLCFELAAGSTLAERVKAHELPGRGWVVIEGVEIIPVTQADYDEQRPMAEMILTIQQQVEFLKSWFDPEQIRQRVGWKDLTQERADSEASKESTAPTGTEPGATDSPTASQPAQS